MPDIDPPAAPRKSITIINAGHHWAFKHFFADRDIFQELSDYYDRDGYRFIEKRLWGIPGRERPRLYCQAQSSEPILCSAQKLTSHDRDGQVTDISPKGPGFC